MENDFVFLQRNWFSFLIYFVIGHIVLRNSVSKKYSFKELLDSKNNFSGILKHSFRSTTVEGKKNYYIGQYNL